MKAISTKYLGATNSKGSRIKAFDCDNNQVTISYPHELSGEEVFKKAAILLCRKMGWSENLIGGGTKDGYVFVFADGYRRIGLEEMTAQEGRQIARSIVEEAKNV